MLALYLQFSRSMMLSISSEGADSNAFILRNGRKIGRIIVQILWARVRPGHPPVANPALELSI